MIRKRAIALAVCAGLPALATVTPVSAQGRLSREALQAIAEFDLTVRASQRYESQLVANDQLLDEGRCDDATRALLELIPDGDPPEDLFRLGNLLFGLEHEVSADLHRRAYEARPDVPGVIFEQALQRHRAGAWGEAAGLYADYLAQLEAVGSPVTDPRAQALRADALIRDGRPGEAVAAWDLAAAEVDAGALEECFHWVHGKPHPDRRRSDLLADIRDGDASRIEELIQLDLRWDTDWWNERTQQDYLVRDLDLARELLGPDGTDEPERLAELLLLADACRTLGFSAEFDALLGRAPLEGAPLEGEELERRARDLDLLGEDGYPPLVSLVAFQLAGRFLDDDLISPDELLEIWEPTLWERVGEDEFAVATLLGLLERAGRDAELEGLEYMGWGRYGIWSCAHHLIGRADEPDPEMLARAVEQFPDRPSITALALAAATAGEDRDALVRAWSAHIAALGSNTANGHLLDAAYEKLAALLD